MRRKTTSLYSFGKSCVFLLLFVLLLSCSIHATIFERDEKVVISNLHQIDEDIYVFCENLVVDGQLDGDIGAFSEKILINGDIAGSATLSANKITINGHIERTLRIFANNTRINGTIGRAVLLFGNDIDIDESAVIGQDITVFCNTLHVSGTIKGNKSIIRGSVITISGTFEGDVHIQGEKIRIEPTATILGNLTYTTRNEEDIIIAPGATITGTATWTPKAPPDEQETSDTTTFIVVATSKLLAAFLFGIILLSLLRKYGEEAFYQIRNRFAASVAVGIIALLIFAFALLLLMLTIILLIVGLVLSSGDSAAIGALALIFSILSLPISSFATVSGAVIFYSGKIVVGFLLGYTLVRLFVPSPTILGRWQLFIGLFLLTLLFTIPYVGFLVYLFVSITGAGAIILGIHHCRRTTEPSPLKNN